jgi:hypothetical protein
MTELYIDGTAVVLPENMNLAVKRENPFFTKNGEYTYELTLSLDNPVNATLYKHLNRFNSVSEIKTKRKVILIADNREYCNGTEIITGWTANTVSIQIASGNSELNYFIGSDLLISSLDLGSATVPTSTAGRLTYIEKTYPDVDFCLTPVLNEGNEEIINKWDVEAYIEGGATKCRLTASGEKYIAQPFLCAIIKKICKAIGYDIKSNQLEQTDMASVYFTHLVDTVQYAQMFPGWTVKDLFEEIEKLNNVSFFINSKERSVQVIINTNFYAEAKLISIKNVIDTYQVEMEEQAETFQESNVSYDLPEQTYYSFARLKKGILNIAERKNFSDYSSLKSYMEGRTNTDTSKILALNLSDGREYVSGGRSVKKVNFLKNIEIEGATNNIELHLIPVSFQTIDIAINHTDSTIHIDGIGEPMPCITTQDVKEEEETEEEVDNSLYGLITANESEKEESKKELFIAFYQGFGEVEIEGRNYPLTVKYPFPFIDCPAGDYKLPGASLMLSEIKENYYNGAYNIDSSKEVKITSYDANVYDPRSVFEIRNKQYVCKEMEYTLSKDGRKKAWKGTFYSLKTERSQENPQWILTDGRWRDTGRWLDNGRWLDE